MFISIKLFIFLYNRLGFVLGGTSFSSIHPFCHPSRHPSSSSLDEEDDGTRGGQMAAPIYPNEKIFFLKQHKKFQIKKEKNKLLINK
jgi:hypothetical protein